jgi:hypothetical protein
MACILALSLPSMGWFHATTEYPPTVCVSFFGVNVFFGFFYFLGFYLFLGVSLGFYPVFV